MMFKTIFPSLRRLFRAGRGACKEDRVKRFIIGTVAVWLTVAAGWAASVDSGDLCGKLGEIRQWSGGECDALKMEGPMGEVVMASRTYRKGDATLQVSVVSGMQAAMLWAPYAAGRQIESDSALVKVERIGEFPVGISYDKRNRSGGVVVQLMPGGVLVVSFEKMGWKEALDAVKSIDWKGLRKLLK